ncbi:tyrosine-type recombinase/integrase [Microbacterium sp.]|uniref:tyrosine-type recombinase/integrase n=1 Tax=Microbacterium sp. TaxID=51671 RepID=UPI003A902167
MGSIHDYNTADGNRYLVRYKKPNGTHAARRGFRSPAEARAYLAFIDASIGRGRYVDPKHALVPVGELATGWLEFQTAVLKPSSVHSLHSAWRMHVEPRWGDTIINDTTHSDVRHWVASLTTKHGASTVIRAHGVLAGILDVAVRDRRLTDNPARGIRLPRKTPTPHGYLTHAQVAQLARQARHPELVYLLAYTGLRWGEATGLRVRDIDTSRRRLHVQENAVTVNGTIHVGTPKTHRSRTVPYPEFYAPFIVTAIDGKRPCDLVFGDGREHPRPPSSQSGWFAAAVKRTQAQDTGFPRVTPHDLRHTAAALAIRAGANVKVVQRMLGHASATMTLDTYAHLFEDDLDTVAGALHDAHTAAGALHDAHTAAGPS